jgi:hydroxymethylpyrimidine/phosphomethylpyrimidine kinase
MLATAGISHVVADFLAALPRPRCPIVLDPILRSSSGAVLLDAAGMQVLLERLLPLSTVVTPNGEEAALLTGFPAGDAESSAKALRRLGASAAVITGGDSIGHAGEPCSEDVLAYAAAGTEFVETLSGRRIHSTSTHGTGCAFSTAIACALARGQSVPSAVTAAKAFVRHAIEQAPGLGQGHGPMGLEHPARD